MTTAFETWAANARAVPIERELDRRGIKLRGRVERCGPCPKCGGTTAFRSTSKNKFFTAAVAMLVAT